MTEIHELTEADGITLRIDRVRARGERRGVIVCLHAMMTDGRYFGARRESSFAATLAEHLQVGERDDLAGTWKWLRPDRLPCCRGRFAGSVSACGRNYAATESPKVASQFWTTVKSTR